MCGVLAGVAFAVRDVKMPECSTPHAPRPTARGPRHMARCTRSFLVSSVVKQLTGNILSPDAAHLVFRNTRVGIWRWGWACPSSVIPEL